MQSTKSLRLITWSIKPSLMTSTAASYVINFNPESLSNQIQPEMFTGHNIENI